MAHNSADLMLLDPPLRVAVERELASGEQVVWLDRPSPARVFRRYLPLGLIGLAWTAAMIAASFWVAGSLLPALGYDDSFTLRRSRRYVLCLAALGLTMIYVPIRQRHRAMRTAYVLTNRRLLVASGLRSASTHSYPLTHLRMTACTERPDGSGDLTFRWQPARPGTAHRPGRKARLLGIPRVRDVEQLIHDTVPTESRPHRPITF